MAEQTMLLITLVLLAIILIFQWVLLNRKASLDLTPLNAAFEQLGREIEKLDRALREEIARNRQESSTSAKQSREELSSALKGVGDTLLQQLAATTAANEQKLESLRASVESRLQLIQEDNSLKLEKIRATVDEQLQGTLEKRLGESFKLVSERLELVHKGLGEMQTLALSVGDLKRVMSNVKTRGGWGEVQLGMILEQLLAPAQFAKNVQTKPGSNQTVEFAVCLPGTNDGEVVYLPIDSKFPKEDYERLVAAQERLDQPAAEAATKMLEASLRLCARDIRDKYLNPPNTTDFAILFLPTEGLYAEVIRRTELADQLQRKYRVIPAGPTTLAALLNSLQMGFRTLAIQKRSSEVWTVLAAVKTEFMRFGDLLAGVRKKLDEAASRIDDVTTKSRSIERKLKDVEGLPAEQTRRVFDVPESPEADDSDTP